MVNNPALLHSYSSCTNSHLVIALHSIWLLPVSSREILATDNGVKQRGNRIYLPELGATLETIAKSGADGFYKGDLAMQIVEDVNQAGKLS